jgi:hypothetical protein
MTEDGEGATWQGTGIGRFTGQGAGISFRGALFHQTASEKLARLNDIAVVFEYEVAADGETATGTFWEWK